MAKKAKESKMFLSFGAGHQWDAILHLKHCDTFFVIMQYVWSSKETMEKRAEIVNVQYVETNIFRKVSPPVIQISESH